MYQRSVDTDGEVAADGCLGGQAGSLYFHHVERMQAIGRMGNQRDGIDRQDIGRLDDVIGKTYLLQLTRRIRASGYPRPG